MRSVCKQCLKLYIRDICTGQEEYVRVERSNKCATSQLLDPAQKPQVPNQSLEGACEGCLDEYVANKALLLNKGDVGLLR